MKKYYLLFLFIIILVSSNMFSQQIISLVERDLESDTFVNRKNVDINSQLVFKLNKNELLKKLNTSADTTNLPSDVNKLLQVLTNALEKKKQWMDQFAQAVISYEAGNKRETETFLTKMSDISGEILSVIRSDSKLQEYVEEEDTTIWVQLTNALTRRVKEVEQELFTSPGYSDVRVKMGGWLIHNNEKSPLHFDGLDTNPLGEFYEVERWRFTPTKEQIAELERLQQLAKEDELNEANLADILKSKYVSSFIDELKERLKTNLDAFKTKAENIVANIGAGAVKTDIQDIIEKSKAIIKLANERIDFYSNLKNNPSFSIPLLVTTLTNDISAFNRAKGEISKLLEKLRTDLENATQAIKNIVANANLAIGDLVEELKKGFLEGFDVLAANRINDLALEFSDMVLSLSLRDIPEEPATDLRYSGYRVPGDKVVMKLVVTRGEVNTQVYQETKDVVLYRILSHVETTVGVIFAHPLSKTSIKKDFQMAPYYNALFKGILRGKHGKEKLRDKTLRNTIWQTSFGLHASTPDFDKDDVPELGFGIVLSTLNDFLQVGTAYNIFHGTPYVFFGVRLPIGNINLSSNKNSTETPGND
jgi:hypothetical protein